MFARLLFSCTFVCLFYSSNCQSVAIRHFTDTELYCIADSATGKIILPLKYEKVYDFSEGLARVVLNKRTGFINKKGVEVIPPKYQNAADFKNGYAWAMLNALVGYIDKKGLVVVPFQFGGGQNFSEGMAAVKKNEKWGFVNSAGKLIIPLSYEDAISFSFGAACVKKTGKCGYIDKTGKTIIPFKFWQATNFRKTFLDTFALVRDSIGNTAKIYLNQRQFDNIEFNMRYAFFEHDDNIEGDEIIEADEMTEELRQRTVGNLYLGDEYVYVPKKVGIFSTDSATYFVPKKFDDVGTLMGPWKWVKTYNGKGVYNHMKEIIAPQWKEVFIRDSLIFGLKNNGSQIYDLTGKPLLSNLQDIGPFINGLALVMKDNKVGVVDKNGKMIVSIKYDMIHEGFVDDLAVVNMGGKVDAASKQFSGGKWGVINKRGEIKIPIEYDNVLAIDKGRVSLLKDGKAGMIDSTGKELIPFAYTYLGRFTNGLIPAQQGGKYGFIDFDQKPVIPFIYDYAGNFSEGMAMVYKDKRCGYIDKTGKIVIPLQYENGFEFTDGFAIVVNGGKAHVINSKGVLLK